MIDEPAIRPMSRLIAVPLFAVLVILVAAIFVFGYTEQAATRAQIATTEAEIALFDARLGAVDTNGGTTAVSGEPSVWIEAPTLAVAAASIQQLAGGIITAAGGTVREVQIIDPDPDAPVTVGPAPVSATFLFETTHAGLRQILMAVEATRPMLKTDALAIEALTEAGEGEGEVPLRVEVRITGYFVKVGAT